MVSLRRELMSLSIKTSTVVLAMSRAISGSSEDAVSVMSRVLRMGATDMLFFLKLSAISETDSSFSSLEKLLRIRVSRFLKYS
ncbi:hypothetical protein ES703_86577 [subsurface metagenome]